jgi:hypothetical protein
MSKDVRYLLNDRSASLFMQVIAEVMVRTDIPYGPVNMRKELFFGTSYIRAGVAARFYAMVDNRKAWIVPSHDPNQVLVWFSDEGIGSDFKNNVTFCKSQDNVIPNHLECHSAYFLHVRNAIDAVERYVLEGILPQGVMPPGHLQSLSGE